MKSKFKKGKVWKWLFGIIFLLLIIALSVGYYLKNYVADRWKPLLTEQLKRSVATASDSLYRIEFSDIDIDLLSGNANIDNFKLIPDTVVYEQLVKLKKAPDNLYRLSVEKLTLRNFKAKKAYSENKLDIGSIVINLPQLQIINKLQPYNENEKSEKSKTPYQLIKNVFKELHIKSIMLKDVDFAFINRNEEKEKITVLRNLNIDIDDVLIDSLSSADTSRFYNTRSIDLHLKNYRLATPDSLYYLNLKDITFSTSKKEIVLNKLSLDPRYDKKKFHSVVKYAKDRYELSFNRISLIQINLQKFLRSQQLQADAMHVSDVKVDVFNNNAYPKLASKKKKHAFPHQQLQDVAFDMEIDTLYIKNADITYAEADHISGQTGVITFKNTHGKFLNVTNNTAAKRINHFMTASLQTRFMNTADLAVSFKFNLLANDGDFNYTGRLGQFDGRALNKITRPLGMVEVESANIKQLSFNIDADDRKAKGTLKFYYNDLKVHLLKKEAGAKELSKQGFISKLANVLVIRSDNPKSNGEFIAGNVNYMKAPETSFFSYLWKGILDGVKPSVGFDKRTEKGITDAVSEVGSLIDLLKERKEKNKIKREQRKNEREQKRERKLQEKGKNSQ
jgi:hypothetical protein